MWWVYSLRRAKQIYLYLTIPIRFGSQTNSTWRQYSTLTFTQNNYTLFAASFKDLIKIDIRNTLNNRVIATSGIVTSMSYNINCNQLLLGDYKRALIVNPDTCVELKSVETPS